MKTVGLVVEYNPLHNGHFYHFEQSKKVAEADHVVAVMSGNFLQRGEPAVVDKWARTRMALNIGIDLVLELPFSYSTQNAELFAHGAISILDATGVVDAVCFGSESGNLNGLKHIAAMLSDEPTQFQLLLKTYLSQGMSYPTAYAKTISELLQKDGECSIPAMDQPNNILGLYYILALMRLNSTIQPFTITRQKAGYHQQSITDQQIASATAIRKILFEDRNLESIQPYVPSITYEVLKEEWDKRHCPINWESFNQPLSHAILTQSISQIQSIYDVGEGFEYRLKDKWGQTDSVYDWIKLCKTKRFTWNRIQRMLLNIMFQRTKQDIDQLSLWNGSPYIRVLGFSEKGKELLRVMRKKAKVPVITKLKKDVHPMLEWDILAAQMYTLAYSNAGLTDRLRDYRQVPYFLGESSRK